MDVGDVMRRDLVSVGTDTSLRRAAELMTSRKVGCAIVRTDDNPGIISERDILRAVAEGADPESKTVGDYMTWDAVVAFPSWDLGKAISTMIEGGFRHLIVVDDGIEVGVLSIRDLAAQLVKGTQAQDT
jgi:CBS domain-containing protein